MAKVTAKLQVTVPKALADRYGIRPGAEIEWQAAGDAIRVVPAGRPRPASECEERLRLFDQATARQKRRPGGRRQKAPRSRGWTRVELYGRDRPR